MKYEIIIGLEFHVQLKTKTKMFCSCDNDATGKTPNTLVCPICLGHPGTLPVVNNEAIKMAIKAALALNCDINLYTKFDRKNYFYPDLPKGYQISQFDKPLAKEGYFDINYKAKDGLAGRLDKEDEMKRIRINRLHVEEDAAKSIHRNNESLIDFNRGGSPLIEIVTEADLRSAQEAKTFAQELQILVRQLELSDADMEKGQLRCDANISLRPVGETKLYPKTEVKNINSFKSLEKALEFEINRQKILWQEGNPPRTQETRGYIDNTGETASQRTKEGFADYRYFPEPDIPPLTFLTEEIAEAENELCELPQFKRQRFMDEYSFSPEDANILTQDKNIANFLEEVVSELEAWVQATKDQSETWELVKEKLMKLAGNWIINKLIPKVQENNLAFDQIKISAENLAELLTIIFRNKLNSTNATKIFDIMWQKGGDPTQIIEEYDMGQTEDSEQITNLIREIINAFPDQVADYKAGKENIITFLLGQVMKQSQGKVNPKTAEELLKKNLK